MGQDKSRTYEARLATKARKAERARKAFECNAPRHSEFVMQQILEHRANYGYN